MADEESNPFVPEVLSAYVAEAGGSPSWVREARAFNAVASVVRELLSLEHLVVLSGSGTSLGIKGRAGAGPTMSDLWREVGKAEDFAAVVEALDISASEDHHLEELLSLVRSAQELGDRPVLRRTGPNLERFASEAEQIILKACSFVDDSSQLESHATLLRVLASRSDRAERAELFTTNYDLCFDRAADVARVTLMDGFGFGTPRRYDPGLLDYDLAIRDRDGRLTAAPRVVRYAKLHGSVDWSREANGSVVKEIAPARPVLIYPRSTKFADSYQAPYLDGMARFQAALRQRSVGLLIVGFGFGDSHLTEPIRHAVLSNPGLRLVAWAPDVRERVEKRSNAALTTIGRLATNGDKRLALVASDFGQLVTVLPSEPSNDPVQEHWARLQTLDQL